MAVTSISRMQVRRGLRSDLPVNLSEGEFGWCLDTRELFIGNGPTWTENTEVLTQYSPNDSLITHIFAGSAPVPAVTGINPMYPIARPLGVKLDDIASVKDYGALGNGLQDDTAAINRAIADRYGNAAVQNYSISAYNPIYLPAGQYLISSTINLYPNTALYGDGQGRTEIFLSNAIVVNDTTSVMQTVDGNGNSGLNIGNDQGVIPVNILLKDLTVRTDVPVIQMILPQRVQRFELDHVALLGPGTITSSGVTPQTLSGNNLPPPTLETQYITLNDSYISNVNIAVLVIDPVNFVSVRGSRINHVNVGFYAGNNVGGPSFTRISDTVFSNITNWAIYTADGATNPGVVSIDNTFYNVNGNATIQTGPVIFWGNGSIGSTSISDAFSYYNANPISGPVTIANYGNNTIVSSQLPINTSSNVHISELGTGIVFADGTYQYTAAVGQGQAITINQLPVSVADQQLVSMVPGRPIPSINTMVFVAARPFTIPQNFIGSLAYALSPPAASSIFTINLSTGNIINNIGTVTFNTGNSTGVFSTTVANINVATGQIVTIQSPSVIDATLSDIGITVLGIKV